jgi:hypothetical protein
MAETVKGIVYPTSGDNIAPLETHFASLAQTADDAIGDLQDIVNDIDDDLQNFKTLATAPAKGSFAFAAPTNTATPVNITISFPPGYFAAAPIVVGCIAGPSTGSAYSIVVHTVTSSQFQVRVIRISGSGAQSLNLNWIAIA